MCLENKFVGFFGCVILAFVSTRGHVQFEELIVVALDCSIWCRMFGTTRQLMQSLDWSPYLENTGNHSSHTDSHPLSY